MLGGTNLYVEGLFVNRTVTYVRPEGAIDNPGTGTPDDVLDANSGEANLDNIVVSPFFGATSDFGIDNFGAGFAVYAPFGGQAEWGQNASYADDLDNPGAIDGVQRWASIEGKQVSLYLTAGAAYRLPKQRLSFGVGFNVIRNDISLVRARNATSTDDMVTSTGTLVEGRSLLTAKNTTMSASIGVMFEPTDNLMFGASYQSQPGFGEISLQGTLTNKFGASAPAATDVELLHTLPDIARIGARYRPNDKVEVRVSGDFQRWSVFDKQCLLNMTIDDRKCSINPDGSTNVDDGGAGVVVVLPRDYKDTFGVRGGASYWVMPVLETFAGLSYDSNAVPDHTIDAALMDMDKIIANLGVRYDLLEGALQLSASYTQVFYSERTTDPRQRDMDGDPLISTPSLNPDGAGTYSQSIKLLTLGAQSAF
jgi:long-chain fatty acid transport protein